MAQLLLSILGSDRQGLVQSISSVVADHGGNWHESQLARLGGRFAGVALVEVDDDQVEALTAAAQSLADLHVTVTPVEDDEALDDDTPTTPVVVHLVGNDRPGIVREVTTALVAQQATIDELHTTTRPAPMADTVLFEATAQVRVPQDGDIAALRDALEAIATELMVDLDVNETLRD